MGYNIPEKIFDQHMHIVRDVHFDVDKYKVNELYVIKHKITNAHTIDGKIVGKLIKAEGNALTFDIFTEVIPEGLLPTDPHKYYCIKTITLLLDDIIEKQIEIERLLTETEATVYVTSAIAKECTKDIIPTPINEKQTLANRYKGDLSIYTPLLRAPNPSPIEQMILSNKSRLKSDIQAAYKIDKDTAKELIENGPMKIVEDMMNNTDDSAVDTNINRLNYVCFIPGNKRGVSFINDDGSFAYEFFDKFKEGIKVNLRCEETAISFRTSPKNITADGDTISMRNGNGTIKMVLHKDSFYKMFDIIRFES